MLEKLVLSQVSSYLNSHNLCNTCQSAYRLGHSTETALLNVVSDLFLSFNKGNISVLALLDFSYAVDTIDYPILVHRLHTDLGFTNTVLQWFSSYLTDRTHYVYLSNHCSALALVHSGVPQGSVLRPMLFTMYIKPLSAIIDSHSIIHLSCIIHLLMTYIYRCLLPQIEYLSYFALCSHVQVMSKLGKLRTCLNLMTTKQNSCLSPLTELSISVTYLLLSLLIMLKFPSNSL